MTTGLDIIKGALRRLGVLRKGGAPAADEAVDALTALNDLVASWSNDGMNVPYRTWETGFALVAGTSSYTIGTGLTINTARPITVVEAYVRDSANRDYPLQVLGDEDFQRIAMKSLPGIPSALNFDQGFPAGRIRLDCAPVAGYTLYMLTEKPLAAFTQAGDVILPPGWDRCMKSNLALALAPEYGVGAEIKMPVTLPQEAAESLYLVQHGANKNRPVTLEEDGYRRYNFDSDQ